jgi:hypothetical protein
MKFINNILVISRLAPSQTLALSLNRGMDIILTYVVANS